MIGELICLESNILCQLNSKLYIKIIFHPKGGFDQVLMFKRSKTLGGVFDLGYSACLYLWIYGMTFFANLIINCHF